MTDKDFVWDEKTVREIIDAAMCNVKDYVMDNDRFVSDFIASKQTIEIDWKVVAVSDKYGDHKIFELDEATDKIDGQSYNYVVNVRVGNRFNIHSVKRLSDREVFSIGDSCGGIGLKVVAPIGKFSINEQSIIVSGCNDNGSAFQCPLQDLQKAKPVLFRTSDGVDIFQDQKTFIVNKHFAVTGPVWYKGGNPDLKCFSTKELAEEYVLMNKPTLSINDLTKNGFVYWYLAETMHKLKVLVQSKLNPK